MRFTDEGEHRRAMSEMQGAVGCGGKPLRVSAATPKRYKPLWHHRTLCSKLMVDSNIVYLYKNPGSKLTKTRDSCVNIPVANSH